MAEIKIETGGILNSIERMGQTTVDLLELGSDTFAQPLIVDEHGNFKPLQPKPTWENSPNTWEQQPNEDDKLKEDLRQAFKNRMFFHAYGGRSTSKPPKDVVEAWMKRHKIRFE